MPSPAELLGCVKRWGRHSLAYAALQPGMEWHGDPARGFIAYRRSLGQAIVLGDPLCPPESAATLLDTFLHTHRRAVFMQVSEGFARQLAAFGFHATPVGVENLIEVADYDLAGKRKQDLRHYRNKARGGGLEVREEEDSVELRQALRPVSDSWLPLKSWHARELAFLARPYLLEPEPGVRIFTARQQGAPMGFVVLDPMYDMGRCLGYVVTLLRHRVGAPEGTVDYINLHVIERLRAEGIPVLNLGVSPFHHLGELVRAHGMGLPTAYLGFQLMHRFGDPLYHFRGLSFHKSRYRAREVPVFTCMRPPIGVWPLVASARACRMI
jgi:lysylphosphatidylglycerol synthetase-like protein (DUF2156 family)